MINKTKFNQTITIRREDINKIIARYKYRIDNLEFGYEDDLETKEEYCNNLALGMERDEEREMEIERNEMIMTELEEAVSLYDAAKSLLVDIDSEGIVVDADEWFEKWSIKGEIDDGEDNKFFMFPYSAEMNEMLKKSVFGRQSPRFSKNWDSSKAREDCYA
jgi:hypothetical protein